MNCKKTSLWSLKKSQTVGNAQGTLKNVHGTVKETIRNGERLGTFEPEHLWN